MTFQCSNSKHVSVYRSPVSDSIRVRKLYVRDRGMDLETFASEVVAQMRLQSLAL